MSLAIFKPSNTLLIDNSRVYCNVKFISLTRQDTSVKTDQLKLVPSARQERESKSQLVALKEVNVNEIQKVYSHLVHDCARSSF